MTYYASLPRGSRLRGRLVWRAAAAAILATCSAGALAAAGASFEIADPDEFRRIIDVDTATLTTNTTIHTWLEGPVWVPSDGGYLVFCDQGNNRLRKLVPPHAVTDFLLPPPNTLYNGTILDAHERMLAAQAGGAGLRIVRIEDGQVTSLAARCNGLRFYSPNDVVEKNDGTIWFTDPGYNGGVGPPPQRGYQPSYGVYRLEPPDGDATCVPVITSGIVRPNGLCFSPDESKLYVADSDVFQARILVYTVSSDNTLSGGAVFASIDNGIPDGIRCDVDGRVWSSAGDGVHIFAPDGHLIGKILFHRTANLCFGGPRYRTLYMTGQPYVTSLPVLVAGMPSVKTLRATVTDGAAQITWTAPSTGFRLEQAAGLGPTAEWTPVEQTPVVTNGENRVTVGPAGEAEFYRLGL